MLAGLGAIHAGCVDSLDISEIVQVDERIKTKSIYRAARASIQIAGHGYQVNLPPAEDAGFSEGDSAPVHPAPGLLVIPTDEVEASRLAADVVTIRHEQVTT